MNEKAAKDLKNSLFALFILEILNTIFRVYTVVNGDLDQTFGLFVIGFCLFFCVLLFIGYTKAKNGKKSACTIGIIVAIFMMLTLLSGDILDFILGVVLLVEAVKYKKMYK